MKVEVHKDPITGVVTTPTGIMVDVVAATRDPELVVWICAHQDVSEGFALHDRKPEEPGPAIVKNLLQRGHYGPFEHPQITFNIAGISRACLAQLTRHRIGVSFDVQSLRYTAPVSRDPRATRDFAHPPYLFDEERAHARGVGKVKVDDVGLVKEIYQKHYEESLKAYRELLMLGVPPEDARLVLPEGFKVNLTMSVNARSLMHILDLRLPPNAQWEIRELCEALLFIAEEWMPHTFKWYRENRAYKHKLAP